MTMHSTTHPDDDRLAAYAGADREAVSDRALAAHIYGCGRCRSIVDELAILRDALADLPDIAPSRPLRLIPPVSEPVTRPSGALEWLRRLAAPAMAAGAGLVLVGAVGTSGLLGELTGKAADRTSVQEASASATDLGPAAGPEDHSSAPGEVPDSEGAFRTDDPRSQAGSDGSAVPVPTGNDGSVTPAPSTSEDYGGLTNATPEQPWLTLLIAGFGLFGISAILRFSLTPRAG